MNERRRAQDGLEATLTVYQRVTSAQFVLEIERGTLGRRKLGHCTGWGIKLHTTPDWNEGMLRDTLLPS